MAVRYASTRGGVPEIGFGDALLTGLAADGGLYCPLEVPPLPDLVPHASSGPSEERALPGGPERPGVRGLSDEPAPSLRDGGAAGDVALCRGLDRSSRIR